MTQEYKPHITDYKKSEVDEIKSLLNEYPVIGIVDLQGIPTLMLQRIRYALGKDIVLKPTKKRFMKFAFNELKASKKDIDKLSDKLEGIPALIFTKEDPFLIYKKIEKNKASAAAKPGQKAPKDLDVEAGETPFTPGPMIGELGMLGLKTEVKNGKISLREGKTLVKSGEIINDKVASLLAKLGVEPMKIGLNLLCTYQDGEILDKSVLAVDEEVYVNNIKNAHSESFILAVHLGIMNSDTAKVLITKAYRESSALAEKADIMTSENIGRTLAKAERAASVLNSQVPNVPVKAPKEEPVENKEVPSEEVKSEEVKDVKEAELSMSEVSNLANKITSTGMTKQDAKFETPKNNESDINDIINTLKDQKARENS